MTLHYRTADKLPGFEVLIADTRVAVTGVWTSGTDLRICLAPEKTSQPDSQGRWIIHDKGLALPEKVSWFHLDAGHLKPAPAPAPAPDEYPLPNRPHSSPRSSKRISKRRGIPILSGRSLSPARSIALAVSAKRSTPFGNWRRAVIHA
jgi:hypothetical protein